MKKRGTTNSNARGNVLDRKRRRAWLIEHFESDLGPGTIRCYRCGVVLRIEPSGAPFLHMTVDRIIPAREGGRYTRGNIRPACSACNRWRRRR